MGAGAEMIQVVDGSGREHHISAAHLGGVPFATGGTPQATMVLSTAGAGGALTVRADHAAHPRRWLERRATTATTAPPPPGSPHGGATP